MTAARGGTAQRGRLLLLALVAAVMITGGIVVWRRSRGVDEDRRIAALDRQRRDLEARQTLLARDIQDAMSGGRIIPQAERRLGLRVPSDSQVFTMTRGASPATATNADTANDR
jgi:cell division protein FtsL